MYLAREASDEGGDPGPHVDAALTLFREALRDVGPGGGYEPLLRLKIAQQTFLSAFADPARHLPSLPHQIRDLRDTRRYFRGRRRDGHEYAELGLARLLLLAVDDAERVTPQLDEAEEIARRLLRRRREPEILGYCHEVLAEAARLRLELTPGLSAEQRRTLQRIRVAALRAAFLAHRQLSVADAAQAGREWARVTAETGDDRATAAAYGELARQVPVEVMRRLDAGKRATFVATQQGVATEAGYWLGPDEPRAAVDAVENARAILLGQRAPGLPVDAERRLRERRRPDLYAAYCAVVDELDAVERALYAAENGHAIGAIHGVRGRHDRLVREICDLLDDVAMSGSEVARAAAGDGFLIYLGAAERGGYALTVGPDGVSWMSLPRATRAEVDTLLTRYRRFLGDRVWHEDELTAVLAALWTGLVQPVVGRLPPGALVTLVPLGALGLFPLHAAGAGAETVDDHVVVRYAPSARMAGRTLGAAAPRAPVTLLAAAVAAAPGRPPLGLADTETEAVCRAHWQASCARLIDARKDDVLAGLRSAAIWHLACHGTAVPDRPLESRLELADGALTVREILSRPSGQHRLAMLSACESAVPDPARLDEVLGFPAALLQSGVRGVVASGWRVDDAATYAIARAFHEEWRGCADPAVVLASTVRWLRTATNEKLHERFGERFAPRPGIPERALPAWRAQQRFAHPRYWAAFGFTGA